MYCRIVEFVRFSDILASKDSQIPIKDIKFTTKKPRFEWS